MCDLIKVAQHSSKFYKDLKSVLLFLPSFLLIFAFLDSFEYEPVRTIVINSSAGQVLSSDSDNTCYKPNSVGLGEANTTEGYRLDSNYSERTKTTEYTTKCLAQRELSDGQTKTCKYNSYNYSYAEIALSNKPVLYHQLLI